MAITRDSTLDLTQVGNRVRILTGIASDEIHDDDLSELISMAIEWFELKVLKDGTGCSQLTDSNLSKAHYV